MLHRLVDTWRSLSPRQRNWVEGAAYAFGAAGWATVYEDHMHGGIAAHTWTTAFMAGVGALGLYWRQTRRQQWTLSKRIKVALEKQAASNGPPKDVDVTITRGELK